MFRPLRTCVVPLTLMLLLVFVPCIALGQNNGGGQGGGGGGGNGNGGVGGIRIDASGLVEKSVTVALNPRELQKRLESSAAKSLPTELNHPSKLRKISLRDLDEEIDRLLTAGQPLPDASLSLAGLTRIDFIFITDEGRDAIIAGPAEGFATQPDGRVVGTDSLRPVLCSRSSLWKVCTRQKSSCGFSSNR